MPTAAKLVAALTTALLAMILSEQVVPLLPEGLRVGNFTYLNGAAGLMFGWRFTGRYAGQGRAAGVSNAVTTNVALVLVLLFYHAFRLMILRSMQSGYASLGDALTDGVRNMGEYGVLLATWEFGLLFGLGSIVIGLASEAAARRWR